MSWTGHKNGLKNILLSYYQLMVYLFENIQYMSFHFNLLSGKKALVLICKLLGRNQKPPVSDHSGNNVNNSNNIVTWFNQNSNSSEFDWMTKECFDSKNIVCCFATTTTTNQQVDNEGDRCLGTANIPMNIFFFEIISLKIFWSSGILINWSHYRLSHWKMFLTIFW